MTEANKRYRERNRAEINRRQREREQLDAHHVRYYDARKAKNIVYYHVKRGNIVKPDRCERCDKVGFVEAAHSDYSKPKEVTWLCRSCHRRWDAQAPKTLGKV
jgi:hypothetical protein